MCGGKNMRFSRDCGQRRKRLGFRLLGALAGICRHVECGLAALSLSVPRAALALTRGYVDDDGPCVLVELFPCMELVFSVGFALSHPLKRPIDFLTCASQYIHSTWCA